MANSQPEFLITYGIPGEKKSNIIAPLIFLGYAIGRIGCFLVGDDYGIPSKVPWAVSFENGIPPTTYDVFERYYPWINISGFEEGLLKVHPTQIYEACICLILFIIIWKFRQNPKIKSKLFFLYLILAGIERFFIEFIRTNEKYFLEIFSGAQIISFLLFAIGIYYFLYYEFEEPADST